MATLREWDMGDLKRIELEALRFGARRWIDPRLIDASNLRFHVEEEGRRLLLELTAHIASERLEEISYPSDWWQAFKERWFPKWAKAKWPVETTRYEARALYPRISMPEEQHYIHLVKKG